MNWTALLAGLVLLVPTAAFSDDPTRAFLGCFTKATLAVPLVDRQPDPSSVAVICEAEPARNLFDSLQLIAAQKVVPERVERRSGSILCVRFAGPPLSYQCTIGISVGGPFADAVK